MRLSRRAFVGTTAGALLLPAAGAAQRTLPGSLTLEQVADRLRANAGVPWRDKTTDGLKAGAPAALVTGIATTVVPSLAALHQAVAARCNLVVTAEPLFYTNSEEPGGRATDPVYLAKRAYIERHALGVFRFADHWSARRPDPRGIALAAALGWNGHGVDGVIELPETTLSALASDVSARLGLRSRARRVGAPALRVRRVWLAAGGVDVQSVARRLPQVDAVIVGEPREWEVVPYVLDMVQAGAAKGLVAIGRAASEEPGMRACADWLKGLVPEVPVQHVATPDPFWSPGA